MEIHHSEETINGRKDGRKFVTYKDPWVEQVDDILCPFCKRPLEFHEDHERVGQGDYATYFNLGCADCSFTFHGLNDDHVFPNQADFLLFCKEKVDAIIK